MRCVDPYCKFRSQVVEVPEKKPTEGQLPMVKAEIEKAARDIAEHVISAHQVWVEPNK